MFQVHIEKYEVSTAVNLWSKEKYKFKAESV